MTDLLPCPFCGGKAKLHTRELRFIGQNDIGDKAVKIGAQVFCNRCKARGPLYRADVVKAYSDRYKDAGFAWICESAQNAWNRRAE